MIADGWTVWYLLAGLAATSSDPSGGWREAGPRYLLHPGRAPRHRQWICLKFLNIFFEFKNVFLSNLKKISFN